MKRDMGSEDHYNFSKPFQKLMRKLEKENTIFLEFEELYLNTPTIKWESRLNKIRQKHTNKTQGQVD